MVRTQTRWRIFLVTTGVRLGPGRWLSSGPNEDPTACSLSLLSCDPSSSSINEARSAALMPLRPFPANIAGVIVIVPAAALLRTTLHV